MKFTIQKAKDLFDLVKNCAVACGDGESADPVTEMVEMRVDGNTLTITALDGIVMAKRRMYVTDAESGVCVIDPTLLMQATSCAGPVEFSLAGSTLMCKTTQGVFRLDTFTSRPFPDYERMLQCDGNTFKICVNMQHLTRIVRAMKIKKDDDASLYMRFDPCNTAGAILLARDDDYGVLMPVRQVAGTPS